MFCQQAKPRAGVAKFLSVGEEIFVTDSRHLHPQNKNPPKGGFLF
jgi:hypothetical protein